MEMSILWDGKRMRTLSHTRAGFKTFPAEAVTYHCLNLATCAENGSHQGLKAGCTLPPNMLERMSRSVQSQLITVNSSRAQGCTQTCPVYLGLHKPLNSCISPLDQRAQGQMSIAMSHQHDHHVAPQLQARVFVVYACELSQWDCCLQPMLLPDTTIF